ncbi:hypothetical protein P7K49_001393 [Saguinus oedipus]|uniref:Uncharacterized protein n=1 Tax=Saguinus oedipus TaxID=9490 RepID=A0ABQ9WI86_SAGOE|nr:hypothetical protein P7K49_001393 [Saguinus oedipus]
MCTWLRAGGNPDGGTAKGIQRDPPPSVIAFPLTHLRNDPLEAPLSFPLCQSSLAHPGICAGQKKHPLCPASE